MSLKDQMGSSSRGRGQGKKGKGKDCGGDANGEKKKKQFDKSEVKCYNCQKVGHFENECELPKEDKSKRKEKMHMAQEDEEEELWLLMVLANEHANVLLQGMNNSPIDDMWYLDTRASSRMTGMNTFFQSHDEFHKGVVRFSDGSSIRYEGKGELHVDYTNVKQMLFKNILYIAKLMTNIFSLGKLDSQGCDIISRDGFITLHDGQRRLLTKTPKTRNMYLLKLNIVEHCLLVEKNDEEAWLWHRRTCHQSAHTLHGMVKGNHAIGLPTNNRQNWVSAPSISPIFWSLNVIINLYFACYHDIMFKINTSIALVNGRVSYK